MAALPSVNTRYLPYMRLGGPQGRSGQVRKFPPPPPGFDPQTVKTVAGRYTDCAIPDPNRLVQEHYFIWQLKLVTSSRMA